MEQRVSEIIVERLGIDVMSKYGETTLTGCLDLVEDLGMGSLDSMVITISFEEEFGLEIPDKDVERWRTVEDVVKYLKKRNKS